MMYRLAIDLDVPDQTENRIASVAACLGAALSELDDQGLHVTGITLTEEGSR